MKALRVFGTCAILVIILAAIYLYLMADKQPLGFCKEVGRALSDQEKIGKVVAVLLNEYPKIVDGKWEIPPGEKDATWKWQKMASPSLPIPYRDMDEFFSINPKCCQITRSYRSIYTVAGDEVTSWDLFTGQKTAIVVVKWLMRYKDNDGMPKNELLERIQAMDNCGNFVNEIN